jgi:hypothetical protein
MVYHPDVVQTDYKWYLKVAEMFNRPIIHLEEYKKNPMDSWAKLIGLQPSPLTKNIQERGAAAREAVERLDKLTGR